MIKTIYLKHKEIINYLIVGILTTIVSLLSYYILVITILNPNNPLELQLANITSWIIAVIFAYITNRKFVFNSKNNNILKEALKFCTSRLTTLFIDMFLMFILVSKLNFNDKTIKIIIQIIVTILNYIISKLLVFKEKRISSK